MTTKRRIADRYFVTFANVHDMYLRENPVDFGYAYEVDSQSNWRRHSTFLDYMAIRQKGPEGETTFQRMYKSKNNYRSVRERDMSEYFPEHFI